MFQVVLLPSNLPWKLIARDYTYSSKLLTESLIKTSYVKLKSKNIVRVAASSYFKVAADFGQQFANMHALRERLMQ
jgi:hypothetical protein